MKETKFAFVLQDRRIAFESISNLEEIQNKIHICLNEGYFLHVNDYIILNPDHILYVEVEREGLNE